MSYIKRDIEGTIIEAAKYFPVITVTGPRQSGKTTMLRQVFPNLHYYSLEDLDTRNFAMKDPVRFLHLHPEGMILDEVHHLPDLLSYIQGIVDQEPEKKFILSGSSNFALLKKVSQSLAGRSGVFELMPLSIAEAKEANLYFYRDSNQNEIDILVSNPTSMDAIEVKSAMTYSPSFEKALKKVSDWVNVPVDKRMIVYAGSLEDRNGDIQLVNYQNLV